jgi:large subunit ribosomal protein L6
MSRIGKQPLGIPEKTAVTVVGYSVTVKGPLGELTRSMDPLISISVADGKVNLAPVRDTKETSALWGTAASHINNMILGVNKLFERKLIVEGIGYKAEVKGEDLNLALGFSHPIKVNIPKGLKVTSEKGTITISGIDTELVGQFASSVRSLKKPEPYKGKGIRYDNEVIRRKEGKKTA